MMIDEYKEKIINPIIEKEKYGINKVLKFIFENNKIKVRNLSSIGYRLLNFILYSHLFYANCLGFISNESMSKYICDGMSCIEMLEVDWNLLKDELKSKGIQTIQIFLNLIFNKISKKLVSIKEIQTIKEHEKLEDEIEKILIESYKEYESYSELYNKNNNKMFKSNNNSIKSLMLENHDIKLYEEKIYPYYKNFFMTIYPTKAHFINELQKIEKYQKKYPVLSYYIREDNPEKFLIKYLPEFNNFCNYMIDYYSYKISREDATKKILTTEEIYIHNKQNFKEKFNTFKNIWKELRPYATKYGCRDEMKPIDLTEDLPIAYFLNDNGDIGKGMYIAAAYENFIEWQNNFLDSLIENTGQSKNLKKYVVNIGKKIDVQKAGKKEVIDFDLINKNFMERIYDNCKKNIFINNKNINYMNYKQLIYDFDAIEKYLEDNILPDKVKFNSFEKLKFVTFYFEGFRGDKSSVLIDFNDKYKQIPLDINKKKVIYDIIKTKFNKDNNKILNIFFSIQLLIYYFTLEQKDEEDDIGILIDDLPNNIILYKECIEFLKAPKLKIKLKELIDIYSFFELLCFESIIDNLQIQYKNDIAEDKRRKIIIFVELKEFLLITKKTLAIACRKFISRYLVGKRKDSDYNENAELTMNLTRNEFWPQKYFDKEEIFIQEINLLKIINLSIGQCYELYKLLGFDEMEELKDIFTNNNL